MSPRIGCTNSRTTRLRSSRNTLPIPSTRYSPFRPRRRHGIMRFLRSGPAQRCPTTCRDSRSSAARSGSRTRATTGSCSAFASNSKEESLALYDSAQPRGPGRPDPGRARGASCRAIVPGARALRLRRRWIILIAALLAACATPAERFGRRAIALGFASVDLQGAGFDHVAYAAGLLERSDSLHVYVEHDGTPWLDLTRPAADPTPRMPFALELMAQDAGPRLFLGRPCYFAPKVEPNSVCAPLLWTHQRYSPEVVASMVAALRRFLALHPFRRVVLIGYSGGGTLAWLMAAQVPETAAIVTVAANLDTDGWTRIHGYSPLTGSLNPALMPPLPPTIGQLHYVGRRDRHVPPSRSEE